MFLRSLTDVAPPLGPTSMMLASVAVALLLYLGWLVVWRLYLSPLASFPGPKLAALSRWYEAYYEIICKGKFSRKIDELHDCYGG